MKLTQRVNLDGLKQLQQTLKTLGSNVVQVGALRGSLSRKDARSNARVGVYMEFGSVNVPRRSWLYNSIGNNFTWDISPYYTTPEFGNAYLEWLRDTAVEVVKNAFNTSGYGTWDPNVEVSKMPGIDTEQLYNSIGGRIVK